MNKLIEKHLQNGKGRGKITTVRNDNGKTMYFSPGFWNSPTSSKRKNKKSPVRSRNTTSKSRLYSTVEDSSEVYKPQELLTSPDSRWMLELKSNDSLYIPDLSNLEEIRKQILNWQEERRREKLKQIELEQEEKNRQGYITPVPKKSKLADFLSPIIDPINKYFDELSYRLSKKGRNDNTIGAIPGKYTIPAILLAPFAGRALMNMGLRRLVGSTVGGIAGERLFDSTLSKITGDNWEDWLYKKTGLHGSVGKWLNPGMIVGGGVGNKATERLFPQIKKNDAARLISEALDKEINNTTNEELSNRLGLLIETTLMYTPPREAYVPTSLKFYERGPARISEAEKTGVPKGERNLLSHGTSLAPYYDYSLINRHLEPWTIENGQFVFAPPWEANKLGTIHFSFNQPVSEHSGGSWMNYPTTVLLPYRNIRSLTPPVDIALMDTFFPNYNGLKISTRGAKVLTGDRKTFEYYRNNGVDVEFSPEIEHELLRLGIYNLKLSNIPDRYKYGRYGQYPSVDRVYEMRREIGENIQKLVDDWTLKNRKPIPSFNKVTELGEVEGLNMKQFPYQLANYSEPYRNLYGDIRLTGMTGLDYTWATDPTNHATFLQFPEYTLKLINNGEFMVRPEYKQYLEWVIKNKADYRK